MKLFFFIFILVVSFGNKTEAQPSNETPIEIRIYILNRFSHYMIGVPCEKLKCYDKTNLVVVKDSNKVNEFLSIFSDTNNFILSKHQNGFDARILIEFIYKDMSSKKICWCSTEYIQKNGLNYIYNEKIQSFLIKEGLIYKLILDNPIIRE